MTKDEFARRLAEDNKISVTLGKEITQAFLETLEAVIKEGREPYFKTYFRTKVVLTKERIGRNPKTGEEFPIPSKKKIKIIWGQNFNLRG